MKGEEDFVRVARREECVWRDLCFSLQPYTLPPTHHTHNHTPYHPLTTSTTIHPTTHSPHPHPKLKSQTNITTPTHTHPPTHTHSHPPTYPHLLTPTPTPTHSAGGEFGSEGGDGEVKNGEVALDVCGVPALEGQHNRLHVRGVQAGA